MGCSRQGCSSGGVPAALSARACCSGGESGSHLFRDRLRLLGAKRVVLLGAITSRGGGWHSAAAKVASRLPADYKGRTGDQHDL